MRVAIVVRAWFACVVGCTSLVARVHAQAVPEGAAEATGETPATSPPAQAPAPVVPAQPIPPATPPPAPAVTPDIVPAPAAPEDEQAPPLLQLDEVSDLSLLALLEMPVQSASKRPETPDEIPANVIIWTRADLERFGYVTLDEVMANVPGIFLVDNYEDQLIGVRGSLGGGIQFLVNGVPQHPIRIKGLSFPERARFNIPVESIDRIEIVRGPLSVIYGNNAFFGSVNVITNDAAGPSKLVSVGYGNDATMRGFARMTQALPDNGIIALNAGVYATDGIGGDLRDSMSAAQLVGVDPNANQSLDGLLSHRNYHFDVSLRSGGWTANARLSSMRYGMYVLAPAYDEGNVLNLDTRHVAIQYDAELSPGWSARALAIYSDESYALTADSVMPDALAWQDQMARRGEVELNLIATPTPRLDFIAGYRLQHLFDIRNHATIETINLKLIATSTPVTTQDLFVQGSYHPLDGLTLTGGLRASYPLRYHVTQRDYVNAAESTNRFDVGLSWVPRAAIIYEITRNHIVKAMYGEAMQANRALTFDELERIRSAELIYMLVYDRVSLQLDGYFNHVNRLLRITQYIDPMTGQYARRVDNSGRLETLGAELLAQARPLTGLHVELSAALQRTRDLANPDIAPGNSPRVLLKAKAAYTVAGISVAPFLHYVSAMKADWQWTDTAGVYARSGDTVDGYVSLGGNVRYDHADTGLFGNLHVSNALGQDIRYPANELVDFQGGGFGPGLRLFASLGWQQP